MSGPMPTPAAGALPDDQVRNDFLTGRAAAPQASADAAWQQLVSSSPSAGGAATAPATAAAGTPSPAAAEPSDASLPIGRRMDQALAASAAAPEKAAPTFPDQLRALVAGTPGEQVGEILPVARDQGGNMHLALPEAARSLVRGIADLLEGAHGGLTPGQDLSPDAKGALAVLTGNGDLKLGAGEGAAAAGAGDGADAEGETAGAEGAASTEGAVAESTSGMPSAGGLKLEPANPADFNLSSRSFAPGQRKVYAITDPDGNRVGFVDVNVGPENTARINDIVSMRGDVGAPIGSNTLGPSATRDLLRQFLADNPGIDTLEGERVSGARFGGEHGFAGSGDEVSVKVSPVNLVAKDGTTSPLPLSGSEGADLKVAPEIRQRATDYLNGVMGDNPVQASLAQIADPKVMDEAIQGVASFIPRDAVKPDEVLRMAAYSTAMQPEDVLAGLKGQLPSDEQIAAWSMLVNSGAKELGDAAQKAIESGAPEDWETAVRAFALQNHVLEQWAGVGTEMGRAFRARQLASNARTDYAKTVQDIIQQVGPGNVDDAVRKIAALQTPEQISNFTAALRRMGSRDAMLYTWYNLLLGPKTVVKKALTDLTMPVWNMAQRYAAERMGSGAVPAGETAQLAMGYAGAFGDAVRAAGRGLMAGRSQFMSDARTLDGFTRTRTSLLANGAEIPATGAPAGAPTRTALAYLRAALPTSWIAGVDDFAKTFHYRSELRALAYREGVRTLLKDGGAIDSDAVGSFVNDQLANPSQALHEQAQAAAQRLTFTEPLTGLAEKLAESADAVNIPIRGTRVEIPLGRIILPFARTPVNFVRFMYRSTPLPLAFPSEAYRAAIGAGGASRDLAYAQMGLGTGLAVSASALAASRMITGRGPSDPKLREAWLAAGNRPYSVQIPGERAVSYPVEPFAMLIGALADTADMVRFAKDEDADQLALSFALGAGHAFLSRTYMQGLADFMDAVQNPDLSGARYVQRLATSLVPRTFSDVAGAIDPWLRAHYSMGQAFEQKLPFVSQSLPHARDVWGDPIPLRDAYLPLASGSGVAHVLSPVELGPSGDQVEPIDQWRWDHRADFSGADAGLPKVKMVQSWQQGTGVKANVRLSPEQYDRFQVLAGNGLKDPATGLGAKDTLNALVQGDGPRSLQREWNMASDAERAVMVQKLVGEFRRAARGQLRRDYPDIDDAIRAQWGARQQQMRPAPAPAGGPAISSSPGSGGASMPHLE